MRHRHRHEQPSHAHTTITHTHTQPSHTHNHHTHTTITQPITCPHTLDGGMSRLTLRRTPVEPFTLAFDVWLSQLTEGSTPEEEEECFRRAGCPL